MNKKKKNLAVNYFLKFIIIIRRNNKKDTYKYTFDPKLYPEAASSSHSITSSKSTSAALSSTLTNNHHTSHNGDTNGGKKAVVSSISIANITTTASTTTATVPVCNGQASPTQNKTNSIGDSSSDAASVEAQNIMTTSSSTNGDETTTTVVTRDDEKPVQPVNDDRVLKQIENIVTVDVTNNPSDEQTIYTMDLTRSQVNFSLSDESPISLTKENGNKTVSRVLS